MIIVQRKKGGIVQPDQIANLKGWFKIGDGGTGIVRGSPSDVTETGDLIAGHNTRTGAGDTEVFVQQLDDMSGAAENISQATFAEQPEMLLSIVNGEPIIRYNDAERLRGSDRTNWTFLHDGTGATIVVVAKATNADNTIGILLATNTAGAAQIGMWLGQEDRSGQANDAVRTAISDGSNNIINLQPDNSWPKNSFIARIVTIEDRAGDDVELRDSSTLLGSEEKSAAFNTSNSQADFTLGDAAALGLGFVGDVAEIFFYTRVLSATERGQVFDYINDKYGV